MFELLQAYEPAKNEKNPILRFFYTNYVKYKLKYSFFREYRKNIYNIGISEELINEFFSFYNCTRMECGTHIRVIYVSEPLRSIQVWYEDYAILYKFFDNSTDIEILDMMNKKSVLIHPDNYTFIYSILAIICIMAIYNYCVEYIYGYKSKLIVNDPFYASKIKEIYF